MSFAQEIRAKIRSVTGTQKITSAMEMVAASKMRKAQARMLAARPYAEKIREVMLQVSSASLQQDEPHPFFQPRALKRIGMMLITSDRGLCGGLNTNLFRLTIDHMQRWRQLSETQVALCLAGQKSKGFAKRLGCEILGYIEHLGDAPNINALIGPVKLMLDQYQSGQLDQVWVAANHFQSTMVQKPKLRCLLPITADPQISRSHRWDYLYEPEAPLLLNLLAKRYIESQIYQAVIENIACEQAARTVAMKNATENADDIINDLQKTYHKARQAAITQELAEIVSGSTAV